MPVCIHFFVSIHKSMFSETLVYTMQSLQCCLMHTYTHYWHLPIGSNLRHRQTERYTEGLPLYTCTSLYMPSDRNSGLACISFAGLVAKLSTLVFIGCLSPVPTQLDLEVLVVQGVLGSRHGLLNMKLGGYAASELQGLEELYPGYENSYRAVVAEPRQLFQCFLYRHPIAHWVY